MATLQLGGCGSNAGRRKNGSALWSGTRKEVDTTGIVQGESEGWQLGECEWWEEDGVLDVSRALCDKAISP